MSNKPKTYLPEAWLLLLTAVTITVFSQTHYSTEDRLKPGYTACSSEKYLTEFTEATHRRQVDMMMRGKCLPTERLSDHPFTQLEDGRVRVYLPDDQYADMYVTGGV